MLAYLVNVVNNCAMSSCEKVVLYKCKLLLLLSGNEGNFFFFLLSGMFFLVCCDCIHVVDMNIYIVIHVENAFTLI